MTSRTCVEVFRAPLEEFRGSSQVVVRVAKREEPLAHGEVRLRVKKRGDAPPRTTSQGETLDEATEGRFGGEKSRVR